MNLTDITRLQLIRGFTEGREYDMSNLPVDQRQFFFDYFSNYCSRDDLTDQLFTRICRIMPEKVDLRFWNITWESLNKIDCSSIDCSSNVCVLKLDMKHLLLGEEKQRNLVRILKSQTQSLKKLTLEHLSLSRDFWDCRMKYNSLQKLSLKNNRLSKDTLEIILKSMPELLFLNLENSQSLKDNDFKVIANAPKLIGLAVAHCQINLDSLKQIGKRLKQLSSSPCLDFSSLVEASPKLESLRLINYNFQVLEKGKPLDVASLFLEDCYFSGESTQLFFRFPKLQHVTFAFNQVHRLNDLVNYLNKFPILSSISKGLKSVELSASEPIDSWSSDSREIEKIYGIFREIKNVSIENITFSFDLKFSNHLKNLRLINCRIATSCFREILKSSPNINRLTIVGGTASQETLESLFIRPPQLLKAIYFDGTPEASWNDLNKYIAFWKRKISAHWPDIEVNIFFTQNEDRTMTQEIA